MLTEASRRADFPSLANMVYLNTAAEGIPPLAVQSALARYFHDKQHGMDGREAHAAELQAIKALTAQFYGLSAQEIGVCSCSSEAYNLANLALRFQPGDEVVVNDLDFPAGVTPWLQPDHPATVRVWRARAGALHVEDLIPLLSPRTRLVTVSLVSFFNGFRLDIPTVAAAVHHHSPAKLAVDVTQALGRIPLDLSQADLIVSSTHKWILASHGGGLVGVPSAQADAWTVPAGGWNNLQDPFGPTRFEKAVSKRGADSFGVGMPNYPAIYAIRAGLSYLAQQGVDCIDRVCRPLVQACLDGLRKLPVEMLTPGDAADLAGIVAFRHPAQETLVRRLHAHNIHVMGQAGRLRVAIHGYNTPQDVERFLDTLHKALRDA